MKMTKYADYYPDIDGDIEEFGNLFDELWRKFMNNDYVENSTKYAGLQAQLTSIKKIHEELKNLKELVEV